MAIVTCHTEGCANADIPIDLGEPPVGDDGQPIVWDSFGCGVCGQPIDDVVEAKQR